MVMLILLQMSFVICQAQTLTRHFVVEFEQKKGSPNQSFSIKRGQHILPDSPSDTTDINDHAVLDSTPYNKNDCWIKTTLIESISWRWLHATHLLVGYELILTTKNISPNSAPYSWLPEEVFVAVGWLLKNYWNPASPFFNPIKQKETSQDQPSATMTMMPGSGHNPPQGQQIESSCQITSGATTQLTGSFTHPLNTTDYDGGNGNPQEHSHTLGLNCFLHPCHGICSYRPSSDDRRSNNWPLNAEESSTDKSSQLMSAKAVCITDPVEPLSKPRQWSLLVAANDSIIIHGLLSLSNNTLPEKNRVSCSLTDSTYPMGTSPDCQQALPNRKRTDSTGQQTCGETADMKNGQQRPCGRLFNSIKALSDHKRRCHTGQKICDATVVGKDGQQRPCGNVCRSALALTDHKSRYHTGQKICNLLAVGKDGQQKCGMVFKNAVLMANHKKNTTPGKSLWRNSGRGRRPAAAMHKGLQKCQSPSGSQKKTSKMQTC